MAFVTQRSFDFEGRTYDIRVAAENGGYRVAVFRGDKRVNPYAYVAGFITDQDFVFTQGAHAYEHLMDIAESDVRARYWDKYLDATKNTRVEK